MLMDNLFNSRKYKRYFYHESSRDDMYRSDRAVVVMTADEWRAVRSGDYELRLSDLAFISACKVFMSTESHSTQAVKQFVHDYIRGLIRRGSLTMERINAACAG